LRTLIALLSVAVAFAGSDLHPGVENFQSAKCLGSTSAPIVIELFSDYQCPACRQLHIDDIRPVITDYVNSGKVYLVVRDFPLPMHPWAKTAARYANASVRLNKFRTVDDKLFDTQLEWSANGEIEKALSSVLSKDELAKLKTYANDPKIEESIASDVALGKKVNLTQTPTMMITHKGRSFPVAGVVSYPILKRFLDNLLTQ